MARVRSPKLIGFSATIKPEGTRSWVSLDRFSDVSDGLLVLALPGVKLASLLPAIRRLWIDPYPRTDIRDCLIEVSFRCKCLSAMMKGRCVSAA
jgi:hypothetical protein